MSHMPATISPTGLDYTRGIISVKDYGAKGDGATGDAAAINAAIAVAATLEWTNFPAYKGGLEGMGATDVSSFDATAGNWIQDGLTVGITSTVTGTGNTFTAPTLTFGGTNAGSFGVQLSDRSARRYRLKLVVTTGGTAALRVSAHGKLGA